MTGLGVVGWVNSVLWHREYVVCIVKGLSTHVVLAFEKNVPINPGWLVSKRHGCKGKPVIHVSKQIRNYPSTYQPLPPMTCKAAPDLYNNFCEMYHILKLKFYQPWVVCNLLGCKGKKDTNPKPFLVAPH